MLVALVLWSASTRVWVRLAGVLHAFITSAVVIVTANHYVLDVLIGAGLAMLAWYVMAQFQPRNLDPFGTDQRGDTGPDPLRAESLRLRLERVNITQRHPQ